MRPDTTSDPATATGRDATPGLVAKLHWAFTCFALLNVVLLVNGSGFVVLRTAALVGYVLAAGLSVLAVLCGPERGRQVTIVLQLAMAPLQFVFSIPVGIALLGIPLSLTILALSRPQFPRMSPRTRKIWLILHVGFSVGWLGVGLTMTVLAIIGSTAASPTMRHGAYELLHVVDLAVAIPSMFLSIITGLVVSLGTKWGLVRHWWVIVKFAISVSIPLVAGTVESALADELALRTADPAGVPGGTGIALTACLAAFTVALWAATILSLVKPWSRTRWGRAADARERQQRLRRVEGVPEPTTIG